MIDNPTVTPFQLWLKSRCIWAEGHQKTLFLVLIFLAAAIVLGIGLLNGFSIAVGFCFCYVTLAGLIGIVAANQNRHLWGWGLAGALGPGLILWLIHKMLLDSAAAPTANHLGAWGWLGGALPTVTLAILLVLRPLPFGTNQTPRYPH